MNDRDSSAAASTRDSSR